VPHRPKLSRVQLHLTVSVGDAGSRLFVRSHKGASNAVSMRSPFAASSGSGDSGGSSGSHGGTSDANGGAGGGAVGGAGGGTGGVAGGGSSYRPTGGRALGPAVALDEDTEAKDGATLVLLSRPRVPLDVRFVPDTSHEELPSAAMVWAACTGWVIRSDGQATTAEEAEEMAEEMAEVAEEAGV